MNPHLLPLLRAAQTDDDSGLFRFYEQLFTRRAAHQDTLTPAIPADWEPPLTPPLLTWELLGITEAPFVAWLMSLATLWNGQDEGALDEVSVYDAGELLAAGKAWFKSGTGGLGSVVDAILANAIAPYLEVAADAVREDIPARWQDAHCPVCGGWADMARYDEKKSRYRCICERCSTEWTLTREACLYCGESDEERRGFYSSEDDLYRVLVCDNCGNYLKVVNDAMARRMGYSPLLPAERLLTPGLDLTAAQEGYTRPTTLDGS